MPTALCGSVQGRQGPEPSVAVRMPVPGEDSQAASPLLAALPGRHRPERRAPSPSARILGTAMGESLASPQALRAFPGSRPFSVPRFQPKLHLALSDGQADAPRHELSCPLSLSSSPGGATALGTTPTRPVQGSAASVPVVPPASTRVRAPHRLPLAHALPTARRAGLHAFTFTVPRRAHAPQADAIPSPCPTSWHREQLSHVTPV